MKYSTIKMKELVDNGEVSIKTGPFGTQLKASEYVAQGTPVLNVKNLGYATVVTDKLDHIGSDTLKRLNAHILKCGDIVFGRKGAVDRHVYIRPEEDGWMQGSDCIRMRTSTDRLNPKYLSYYFLTTYHRKFMVSMCAHGTTMASLNQKILEQIELPVPERKNQDRIVKVLSALDDKIELNQRIYDNLFNFAMSLYKQAILDNNDILRMTCIGEVVDVKGGKRLPKGTNLQSDPNGHPYIKVRDLNNAYFVQLTSDFEFVDVETQKGISKYIVNTSDVIVSIVGTIGLSALIHNSLNMANLTENCVKLTNFKEISPEYLLLFLRSDEGQKAIQLGTVGAVQAKLPIKNIQSIQLPILPQDKRNNLYTHLHTLFDIISAKLSENVMLAEIRDTLLPKLMSGEIDVRSVNN